MRSCAIKCLMEEMPLRTSPCCFFFFKKQTDLLFCYVAVGNKLSNYENIARYRVEIYA